MSLLDIDDAETVEGQGEAKDKVLRFIKNIIETVESEEDEFTFNLYKHGRGGEGDDPVFSSEIPCKGGDIGELTDDIIEAAIEDASEFYKGSHKYVVKADNVRARCVFTLKVNPKDDEDIDDIEEAPSKKGLMSQLMRHQEKIIKVAMGSVQRVIDTQARALRDKDERINTLESKQVETIRMTEELVSGKHARDIELRRIEKKEKRMDEVLGMAVQGAPMLLQMVAASGQKSSPAEEPPPPEMNSAKESPLENLVDSIIGSFTLEQFQNIAKSGLFQPEQVMMLMELAKYVNAKEEAKDKARAAAAEAARRAGQGEPT